MRSVISSSSSSFSSSNPSSFQEFLEWDFDLVICCLIWEIRQNCLVTFFSPNYLMFLLLFIHWKARNLHYMSSFFPSGRSNNWENTKRLISLSLWALRKWSIFRQFHLTLHFLQHAVVFVNGEQYYGAKANINVWAPHVSDQYEFSLSQMWVISGSFNHDLNTIEAGWQACFSLIYFDILVSFIAILVLVFHFWKVCL